MLLFINPLTSTPYKSVPSQCNFVIPAAKRIFCIYPVICGGDLFRKITYSLKGGKFSCADLI